MLANFFGKSNPVNLIIIAILFLGYCGLQFFVIDFETIGTQKLVDFAKVLPLFLLLFFLYNFIVAKNKLTHDNSYAFLFFVISFGFIPIPIIDFKWLSIHIVLFLFFRKVYSLRSVKSVYQKLFDGGLWCGVLFLFSPFYILYLTMVYVAIFLFSKITLRTVLIPVLGFLSSLILYFTYCFFIEDLQLFYTLFIVEFVSDFSLYNSFFYIFTFVLFGVFAMLAIFVRSGKIFSISNTFKRSWVLLLIHLIIGFCFVLSKNNKDGLELIAFFIPVSIIIANWIQFLKKKWLVNLVLILFLVASFFMHFL